MRQEEEPSPVRYSPRMLQLIDPIHKQIILVKLDDLRGNVPDFPESGPIAGDSPQRQWLSQAGALLKKVDPVRYGWNFDQSVNGVLGMSRAWGINGIKGQILDAIEALKLDLDLEGRGDFGNVYGAGQVYEFFRDLKAIVGAASKEALLVDPYFNGQAFDDYLSTMRPGKTIKILAERYVDDVQRFAARHAQQYGTNIEIRRSSELHDRLVIVDNSDCWVVGASIKDAAVRSSTYLFPLQPVLANAKRDIYSEVWDRAEVVE